MCFLGDCNPVVLMVKISHCHLIARVLLGLGKTIFGDTQETEVQVDFYDISETEGGPLEIHCLGELM